jgi:hypothetical protein
MRAIIRFILSISICISLTSQVAVAGKINIFQIFDQFLLASHAASSCTTPDDNVLTNQIANFQAVWLRTAEEIKKRNPSDSEEVIEERMNNRNETLKSKVKGIIKQGGCEDSRIQTLIKLFSAQAEMKLG